MDNLSGIYPSFGTFTNDTEIEKLIELLGRVGATYSDELTAENTHLVCTVPKVSMLFLHRDQSMKRHKNLIFPSSLYNPVIVARVSKSM
jgi:twin BRCT domain